jgi:hypothetical protein
MELHARYHRHPRARISKFVVVLSGLMMIVCRTVGARAWGPQYYLEHTCHYLLVSQRNSNPPIMELHVAIVINAQENFEIRWGARHGACVDSRSNFVDARPNYVGLSRRVPIERHVYDMLGVYLNRSKMHRNH